MRFSSRKNWKHPILWLLLIFCSSSFAQTPLHIFTCEPEWAALAHALGNDQVEIFTATTELQDPHHIEARPALIAQLRRANLLICSGAELEVGWLPLLLRSANNAAVMPDANGYFEAAMQVNRLDVPTQLDRSLGDIHAYGNPHVQLDPLRMLKIAGALTQKLMQLDPPHAQLYQNNLKNFNQQMQHMLTELQPQLAQLKNKPVVIHHGNWKYLADWLQLKIMADVEPKPGIPPSPNDLNNLLQQVRNQNISVIIRATYQADKPTQWLSEQIHVPVLALPATVENGQSLTEYYRHLVNELSRVIKP